MIAIQFRYISPTWWHAVAKHIANFSTTLYPNFRSDNPMTLMTYLSQTSDQTRRNDRYTYVALNGRGNWALNFTYGTAGNSKHLRYVSNAANI